MNLDYTLAFIVGDPARLEKRGATNWPVWLDEKLRARRFPTLREAHEIASAAIVRCGGVWYEPEKELEDHPDAPPPSE